MEFFQNDPWVANQVDEIAAPFKKRLSESELIWLKQQLFELLSEDARAAALLKAARPRVVDESGEVAAGTSTNGIRARSKAG